MNGKVMVWTGDEAIGMGWGMLATAGNLRPLFAALEMRHWQRLRSPAGGDGL